MSLPHLKTKPNQENTNIWTQPAKILISPEVLKHGGGPAKESSRLIQPQCDQPERSEKLITADAPFLEVSAEIQGIPGAKRTALPCSALHWGPPQPSLLLPKHRIPQATSSARVNSSSSQNSCRDGTETLFTSH